MEAGLEEEWVEEEGQEDKVFKDPYLNNNMNLKRNQWILVAVIAVVLIVLLNLIVAYNNFVVLNQDINSKWSEVNNQYQRQADLIPNLVSIVSSAVKVETNFTLAVTEARSRWQSSNTNLQKDQAGVEMTNSLATFVKAVAVSENYPVLQANKQYVALTDELAGTQNRITVARGAYIKSVQNLNTAVMRFPSNIIAGMFGFKQVDYYKADSLTTPILGTGLLP